MPGIHAYNILTSKPNDIKICDTDDDAARARSRPRVTTREPQSARPVAVAVLRLSQV